MRIDYLQAQVKDLRSEMYSIEHTVENVSISNNKVTSSIDVLTDRLDYHIKNTHRDLDVKYTNKLMVDYIHNVLRVLIELLNKSGILRINKKDTGYEPIDTYEFPEISNDRLLNNVSDVLNSLLEELGYEADRSRSWIVRKIKDK